MINIYSELNSYLTFFVLIILYFVVAFFMLETVRKRKDKSAELKEQKTRFTYEVIKDYKTRIPIPDLSDLFKYEHGIDNTNVFEILTMYNSICKGIIDGIYDEEMTRILLEDEMKTFNQFFNEKISYIRYRTNDDTLFLEFEMTMTKWRKANDINE